MVLFSLSNPIPAQYLQIGHRTFLPNPYLFANHDHLDTKFEVFTAMKIRAVV
jgi:hypothetical protein